MSFISRATAAFSIGTDWNQIRKVKAATLAQLAKTRRGDLVEVGRASDPVVMKAVLDLLNEDPMIEMIPWDPKADLSQVMITVVWAAGAKMDGDTYGFLKHKGQVLNREHAKMLRHMLATAKDIVGPTEEDRSVAKLLGF